MAFLKGKKELGVKTVVEITVEGSLYISKNGVVNHNCNECKRLYLLDDGVTPRAFKMSQVTSDYHKKGGNTPSLCGCHPNCRCSLQTVPQGWGYKGGKISFISKNYDLYKDQNGES